VENLGGEVNEGFFGYYLILVIGEKSWSYSLLVIS
jgi:hypothetical protein